jgi:hypothetical protein
MEISPFPELDRSHGGTNIRNIFAKNAPQCGVPSSESVRYKNLTIQ